MMIYRTILHTIIILSLTTLTESIVNCNLSSSNSKTYSLLRDATQYTHKSGIVQSDLERTLQYIKEQYKKNSIKKYKIDLSGSNLLVYDDDNSYYEFNLDVVSEIKSEYDLGKYMLNITVDSKSTLGKDDEINVIKRYNSQGFVIDKVVGVGMRFNTLQNATLTRDAIRKLKRLINS